MPELTNPRSERVRSVKALAGRSARQRRGAFLVEGPQGVREALTHGGEHVQDVYLTPETAERYPEIADGAGLVPGRLRMATPDVLAAMSGDAQEVLAVARPDLTELTAVVAGAPRLVVVLAHVRDPGNAGAVIRAADAAGADAVVLTQASVDVHNPKVVRSTAGSLFHVPVSQGLPLPSVVDALRGAGLQVLAADGAGPHDLDVLQDAALTAAGGSPDGSTPDLRRPTAWVFGNEAWGLRPEDAALADAVVRVPIHGHAESLNLATAATLCLYASARALRRTAPGAGA